MKKKYNLAPLHRQVCKEATELLELMVALGVTKAGDLVRRRGVSGSEPALYFDTGRTDMTLMASWVGCPEVPNTPTETLAAFLLAAESAREALARIEDLVDQS